MADYRVYVGNRIYDVRIEKDLLLVNGAQFNFDLESINGNGMHILRDPNRNVEAYLQSNQNGSYDIQIDGIHLSAEVVLGFHNQTKVSDNNKGLVISPMPGLIVDILVKEGDNVQEGDTILIQEAMKMQMKIRSASAGKITKLHAAIGDQVNKDELLVSLDPAESLPINSDDPQPMRK
ncbi:MAG: biotin/lipoyl-binding protein [Anaerolineales bacterium]|nr:biotin/lipoyl-binding protein [Anaerolineales bacterium]